MLELDPAIAVAVATDPLGTVGLDNLAKLRENPLAVPPPLSDEVERRDVVVPGEPDVTIRVHRPVGVDGLLPCVYGIHGGGYVMGGYEQNDARFDVWCRRYRCVGVSVEYRLAPETAYPGPLDDCYAGLKWVHDHAEEIGVDRHRIGVGGSSAGGGLSAGVALLARDRGEIPVQFQLLESPMLDDRQATPSSQLDGLAVWSKESNTFAWRSYLGDLYGTDDVPMYAAPARATDLRGLPPAYVCVGAVDGFRDEDITYAMRLNQAGVPAELHVYAGLPHGVSLFATTPVGRRYLQGIEEWVGHQLAGDHAG